MILHFISYNYRIALVNVCRMRFLRNKEQDTGLFLFDLVCTETLVTPSSPIACLFPCVLWDGVFTIYTPLADASVKTERYWVRLSVIRHAKWARSTQNTDRSTQQRQRRQVMYTTDR
jgi:hypothetical protein